ncbi:hypothetical protein ACFX13_019143 [Malus domestica]
MSVERSFEVWEEVQRHGQDLADRLTQGFTGLIQSHITPPPIRSPGLRLHSSSSPNPQASQPTKGTKKVAIAASVGIVTLGMLSGLVFFLYRHRVKHPSESQKLVNGRIHRSQRFTDDLRVPPSSFLYISTVEPSHTSTTSSKAVSEPTTEELNRSPYRKSNSIKRSNRYRPSPELQLLPPLHHHLALHLCESVYSVLKSELMEDPVFNLTKDSRQWVERMLDYNVPGGKLDRGLSVFDSYQSVQQGRGGGRAPDLWKPGRRR